MTHLEMLTKLIECVEKMTAAKEKYEKHPGGGASQKIKNKLFQEYRQRLLEMNNAVFNIKQLLK
jgi:hypothetical protein